MPNQPLIIAKVNVTSKDINGNSIAKQYNSVLGMNFDYNTGRLNIIDSSGSFYFALSPTSTVTYTITLGTGGSHSVTIS